MRIFGVVDGSVDRRDRAQLLTLLFDLDLRATAKGFVSTGVVRRDEATHGITTSTIAIKDGQDALQRW